MQTTSPFNPFSPQAAVISGLFTMALILMGIILLIVAVLVVYVSYRFRASRQQDGEPFQNHGNRRLEIMWTVAPGLLVLVLFLFTLRAMHLSDPYVPPKMQPDLVVIGHQWWWELQYPKSGVLAANEIHIPIGKALLLRIVGADVIHSFWVPQLGRKMDAIPGHPNHVWLRADKPGKYLGTCSEYCGAQHAWMRIQIIAQTQADFDRWQQAQLEIPPQPTTGLAARGLQIFKDKTCCHTIEGVEKGPAIGPDLTHLFLRKTLGTGILQNTPDNLARWLKDPTGVKPGIHMPDMRLTDLDVAALVAYLETSHE
ncbi:MAG: cytochrome c oxidase subunit II [Acidobacteriota bacterium]